MMKKKKKTKLSRLVLIPIFIGLCFTLVILIDPNILGSFVATGRPVYCKPDTVRLGSYVLSGECIPDKVFTNLPSYPNDLSEMKILIRYGKVKDLTTVEEKYYKQPEFYLNWDPSGIDSFFNPPGGYFGAFGFGAYPADTVAIVKPGEALRLGTFFKTSWGVENYQGMQLMAVFPEYAESKTGKIEVSQNPTNVRNYFDVSIDPNTFILEPTFGIFEKDWARKITVIIRVKPDTPPGEYVVGISPTAPPSEMEDQWLTQYGLRYVSAGGQGIGRPFYQVFIEVQD